MGPSEGCHPAAPMPVTCGTEIVPGWNQSSLQAWDRVHQASGEEWERFQDLVKTVSDSS